MKVRLLKYWDRLRSSFWFVPSIMIGVVVGLAFASIALDELLRDGWLRDSGWTYTGSATGASAVLETIAGSMMTIAGVVFSMTLVALTLASSQFGPRLLRSFMSDTSTQVVLGTFVATFIYCLLVLRAIRHGDQDGFVPHLSITVAVVLALVSIGVLIYFIHHVAVSIQADEIVARVGAAVVESIDRVFPEQIGRGGPPQDAPPTVASLSESFGNDAHPVQAGADGYIQFIDGDALLSAACEADLVVRLEHGPGHYLSAGATLAMVWPGERLTERVAVRLREAIVQGEQRTPAQDAAFAVTQLVEIAVRSLSPGVNDPFTAIRCVDRLGSALCRLAQRAAPSPYRRDGEQRVRVIATPVSFPAMVDTAFDLIRQNARNSAAVTIRLLETIAAIAPAACRAQDFAALRRQAEMIARGAGDGLPEGEDRRAADERFREASRALDRAEAAAAAPP